MPNPHHWYEIKAAGAEAPRAAEIYVYGNIGDKWDENGVVAADFVRDIAALDVDTITLRINSYGGSVPDGLAIYNALKRHRAEIDVQIDGVAISCAGYIAMAGDTITMAGNAQLMIHAPWGITAGNAADLREQADVLDRYARAMASAYADKSGKPFADCIALLDDGKDHWFSAEEALAEGFADSVGAPVAVAAQLARSFDLSHFTPRNQAAQAAAKRPEKSTMTDAVTQAAAPAPAQPFARTKDMNAEVLAMFKPFLDRDGVQALQTEVLTDPTIQVEQIQARLLVKLGEGSTPATPENSHPRVETVEDETDKRRDAITAALLTRAGVADQATRAIAMASGYRAHKLLDLAKASLDRGRIKHSHMDSMQIVAAAFTQSTSDFPVLLENAMHKTLQNAYATAADTWSRFCARGSVSDFRAHPRYRTGSIGNLDALNELGEFDNKSIPDGEKASITAGTKGNVINLSRQAIINDDLGAFIGLAANLGRAAKRTVEADVYATLALNSGMGPTLGDGYTLFHANHNNVGTGAAISIASIDADRVKLASQTDVGGNDYLGLSPSVLLVPLTLGGTARSIVGAEYNDEANKNQRAPNIIRNIFDDIVDSPRMTGTRRYMFASPAEAPVLEVAFLDGNDMPYLESETGFSVDGTRWKVRLDYGIGAIDYRGATTNAGA